ncbi:MAG: ParA family protein [Candidatus Thiodiazotropha sp.]|jgi:chromosome partitioning protein
MRRMAVINQCGNVGKTTIATCLGHALSLSGHRVTLVDLDPEGGLAAGYGIFRAPSKGIDRVMLNGTDLRSVKIGARDLLTLIPAGGTLAQLEQRDGDGARRAHRLSEAIEGQLADQRFVIFDCPSSSGLLSVNAIFAADELLIPVTSEAETLNGALRTLVTLKRLETYLPHPVAARIVLNRITPRRKATREMRQKLQQLFPGALLDSAIREGQAIAESGVMGRTIFEYKAASHSAEEFKELANELLLTLREASGAGGEAGSKPVGKACH